MKTSIKTLAAEMKNNLHTITVGDAQKVTMKENRPDWVQECIYQAHSGFLPDDYRYDWIDSLLDLIGGIEIDEDARADDQADELRQADEVHETIDNMVPVYNATRLQWLASNLKRPGYVDEAREDGLIGDKTNILDQIAIGIYKEIEETFTELVDALRDELESREPEEGEDAEG